MTTTTTRCHQYAIDVGWDFTSIEATAEHGIADADRETLEQLGIDADDFLAWCRERVAEAVR